MLCGNHVRNELDEERTREWRMAQCMSGEHEMVEEYVFSGVRVMKCGRCRSLYS